MNFHRPNQMYASLADQLEPMFTPPPPCTLAVALGANLPSKIGTPSSTLKVVRPTLEKIITEWIACLSESPSKIKVHYDNLRWRWSPLFETDPVGGPPNQPCYVNAVLLVDGPQMEAIKPYKEAALNLLEMFLKLEKQVGRDRQTSLMHWEARCLDIDLLAWGDLQVQSKVLTLPHPRLIERNFVITPLAAALNIDNKEPRRISASPNWLE